LRSDQTNYIYEEAGFKLLNNANYTIYVSKNSCVNLVGIESMVNGNPDIVTSFSGINTDKYTLVVSHCPDIFSQTYTYNYDYFVSGHSLGGRVYIPIISFFMRSEGCEEFYRGKYVRNGYTLDISNGIGFKENKARFLADSEVVLYTLRTN